MAKDTQEMLRKQGANVVLVGQIYSDALKAMHQAAEKDPNASVVHRDCPRTGKPVDYILVKRRAFFVRRPSSLEGSLLDGERNEITVASRPRRNILLSRWWRLDRRHTSRVSISRMG